MVRGAVISELQQSSLTILKRIARWSYGIKYQTKGVDGDPLNYKTWRPVGEEYECDNLISWIIRKVPYMPALGVFLYTLMNFLSQVTREMNIQVMKSQGFPFPATSESRLTAI